MASTPHLLTHHPHRLTLALIALLSVIACVADCAAKVGDDLALIKGFIIESVKGNAGAITNVYPICQRNPLNP